LFLPRADEEGVDEEESWQGQQWQIDQSHQGMLTTMHIHLMFSTILLRTKVLIGLKRSQLASKTNLMLRCPALSASPQRSNEEGGEDSTN
jgi:hypothetical protein